MTAPENVLLPSGQSLDVCVGFDDYFGPVWKHWLADSLVFRTQCARLALENSLFCVTKSSQTGIVVTLVPYEYVEVDSLCVCEFTNFNRFVQFISITFYVSCCFEHSRWITHPHSLSYILSVVCMPVWNCRRHVQARVPTRLKPFSYLWRSRYTRVAKSVPHLSLSLMEVWSMLSTMWRCSWRGHRHEEHPRWRPSLLTSHPYHRNAAGGQVCQVTVWNCSILISDVYFLEFLVWFLFRWSTAVFFGLYTRTKLVALTYIFSR